MITLRHLIVALSILLFTVSTSGQAPKSILGSLWRASVTSMTSDSLWLRANGRYILYDCEINERFYGIFKLVQDTVLLFQESGQYDRQTPERGSRKALFKFLLEGDLLRMIYSQPSLRFPPTTDFDSLFVYRRVKP